MRGKTWIVWVLVALLVLSACQQPSTVVPTQPAAPSPAAPTAAPAPSPTSPPQPVTLKVMIVDYVKDKTDK